jgi:hypothetical protein
MLNWEGLSTLLQEMASILYRLLDIEIMSKLILSGISWSRTSGAKASDLSDEDGQGGLVSRLGS